MNAPTTITLADGSPALFIPKTAAQGGPIYCCPLCEGFGTVKRFTIAHIVRVVTDHYRLDAGDILSDCKEARIARPRQEAMYLCRRLTTQSYPCIGKKFGRDHTTVLHAVRQTTKRMAESADYERDIENLMLEAVGV